MLSFSSYSSSRNLRSQVACAATAALLTGASLVGSAHSSWAQTIAPPAFSSAAGGGSTNVPDSTGDRTEQIQFAASQLTGLTAGTSVINGLSFRVYGGSGAPSTNETFTSYKVTLSQAARTISSFSTTFASNIGANSQVVFNGTQVFTQSSFSTGSTVNAFGPTVNFTMPYVYQGGDLVLTFNLTGSQNGQSTLFDAVPFSDSGYGTNYVAQFGLEQNATTADGQTNAPVAITRFNLAGTAAPEPGSAALLVLGLTGGAPALLGTVARRRRRG